MLAAVGLELGASKSMVGIVLKPAVDLLLVSLLAGAGARLGCLSRTRKQKPPWGKGRSDKKIAQAPEFLYFDTWSIGRVRFSLGR